MIEFKNNLLYTKNNEWTEKINDIVRVGIDDYSQKSLGDIVYVEICPVNTRLKAGDSFGSIEATKSVSEIISPVSGVVVKVNDAIKESPAIVNIDPFGDGWLIEIKPDDISELDNLMNVGEYKKFLS
ncbi:MAG: glycine cleavage system protein GcvH [Synergistaceae bacterium]|nr:glycine cleavage system protein GcvH [Synergistaceae bacterium]